METAQVKFFPIKFIQTNEKLEELYRIQLEFTNFYRNLERDCTKYEYYARKYALHKRLRNGFKLIKNEC